MFFVDDQTLMKVVALFGEAVNAVQVLKGADEVKDKEIADETQINIHVVRETLYKLYDHSLVVLRQSRTRKHTGLFTIGGFNLTSSLGSSHP